jgi:hypothetical protein
MLAFRLVARSSAVGEDSEQASFAGQHLTRLNLRSEPELVDAVSAIWDSSRSPSALAYRERLGLPREPRIAVVVQELVDADSAGVLFSRNPLDGSDELVIEAARGLGESVVAGLVTPDRVRLRRDGAVVLGADWRIRSMAADLAQPGDVIVLAAGGLRERACFGDMTATCWKSKGIEGVVVDGAARDVARLRGLAFPVFGPGVTPRNFHYPTGLDHGAVNVPVACAGVLVEPGHLLLGDDDGVVWRPRGSRPRSSRRPAAISRGENAGRVLFGEQYVSFGVKR